MPINTENTLLELVTSYNKNPDRFAFFVGAGLSQPLFPSWKNLLSLFLEKAKEGDLSYLESELAGLIESGESYLDVADTLVDSIGSTRYRDIMESIFDKDFSENELPEAYQTLMNLAPKTIVTTNYDRIPEIAGKGKYRVHTNKTAPEAARSFSDNKNTVFKLHGDIADQSSIVLTTTDYRKVVYDNQSTRLFINSLLSTKILIFVGFSLSDPHIDDILKNIMSINKGLPLSHYVLLNEQSKFKIASFEKNYGVKVIAYSPTDDSHPEVADFLRALDNGVNTSLEKVEVDGNLVIDSPKLLIEHLKKFTEKVFAKSPISIFYHKRDIFLSFTPIGETKSEIQKELISIIRLMNFSCSFAHSLIIVAVAKTPPITNFEESHAILIKAKLRFEDANRFANKEISTSTVWQLISFYSPSGLSDILQKEESVNFPMNIGLIGE